MNHLIPNYAPTKVRNMGYNLDNILIRPPKHTPGGLFYQVNLHYKTVVCPPKTGLPHSQNAPNRMTNSRAHIVDAD